MSFMFTSGAHVGRTPQNPSYGAYDYEEIERQYSYNAGYRAAKEEYEDELNSWRGDVEKLMAKLADTRARCDQLEQLCRDTWTLYKTDMAVHQAMKAEDELMERMDALGLLEGDN